jgi:hypothetical protein
LLFALNFNGQTKVGQLDCSSFGFAGQEQIFRLEGDESDRDRPSNENKGKKKRLKYFVIFKKEIFGVKSTSGNLPRTNANKSKPEKHGEKNPGDLKTDL